MTHSRKEVLPINVETEIGSSELVKDIIRKVVNETMNMNYFDYYFQFAYPDSPFKGNDSYIYYTIPKAVTRYKVNNTVLLMLTDWGYLNQFWNSYVVSNLKQYSNLVVACLDTEVYEVIVIT